MTDTTTPPPKKRPGFQPGQSGNPKGRPKSNLTASDLRKRLAKDADAIIDTVVQAALAGDVQAAKLVLERLIPAIKPSEQAVKLAMPMDASLTDQGRAVVTAVANGELAPGQGSALLASIGTVAKLTETDELIRRIEALEAKA